MSVLRAIKKSFDDKEKRGWDKLYHFVDLHGTVIKPNWSSNEIPSEFYDHALDVLRLLTRIPDICLVIYTCSHPHEVEVYLRMFKENGVIFTYVNENPEVETRMDGYGCYDKKPY